MTPNRARGAIDVNIVTGYDEVNDWQRVSIVNDNVGLAKEATLSAIEDQTDKLTFDTNNNLKTALAADEVGLATEATLSAIKTQTDKLTFDANNFIKTAIASDEIGLAKEATLSALNNKIPMPINQFPDGSLVINNTMCKQILNGNGYNASKRFTSVADSTTTQILLENPSTSGKTIRITSLDVLTTGKCYIDIYKNASVTTAGTSMVITNLNTGSTNTTVATVEYNGTYDTTNATLIYEGLIPGTSGGDVVEGKELIIAEGTNILVNVTNSSGASIDLAVSISWHEQ